MNDRNLDQLLDAWMDLGPNAAPARVAEAARLEARTTRQSAIPVEWRPLRFPEMNNTAKLALGAAAVVVAALIGFTMLGGPSGIGSPRVNPTPSATPDLGESLVRQWVAAINAGDRDALVAITAERVATGDVTMDRDEKLDMVLDAWCPMTVNSVERVGVTFLVHVTFRDNRDGTCTDGTPGTTGTFVLEVGDGKVTRIP